MQARGRVGCGFLDGVGVSDICRRAEVGRGQETGDHRWVSTLGMYSGSPLYRIRSKARSRQEIQDQGQEQGGQMVAES